VRAIQERDARATQSVLVVRERQQASSVGSAFGQFESKQKRQCKQSGRSVRFHSGYRARFSGSNNAADAGCREMTNS